jgi:peptidoglycan-N-acetylglucosamine deacetylase
MPRHTLDSEKQAPPSAAAGIAERPDATSADQNAGVLPTRLLRWFPSPFLRASVLFQVAGWPLSGSGVIEASWLPAALLLNHALVFGASVYPRGKWLGPNLVRLPAEQALRGEVALTFDDGPDPYVTPRVLDLLDEHHAPATFFLIGERARRHPSLVREIQRRGHQIENHSDRHRTHFALQGPGAIGRELRQAQGSLAQLTGREPRYFRAPFGMRNPWVQPVLDRLNLRLVSWTRRGYDAVRGDPARVASRLLSNLQAGDILLLHDGTCARTRQGQPVVLAVLPRVLQKIESLNLRPVRLEPLGA